MKNLMLLAATAIIFFVSSSCRKDKVVNIPANDNTVSRASNTAEKKPILVFGPDRYRVWIANTVYCVYTGGNCLDDVIIIAPKVSQLMSIITYGGAYGDFISRNMEDLSTDIPEDYLRNVVDQKYTLSIKRNNETKIDYLLFQERSKTVLVIPFHNK